MYIYKKERKKNYSVKILYSSDRQLAAVDCLDKHLQILEYLQFAVGKRKKNTIVSGRVKKQTKNIYSKIEHV